MGASKKTSQEVTLELSLEAWGEVEERFQVEELAQKEALR